MVQPAGSGAAAGRRGRGEKKEKKKAKRKKESLVYRVERPDEYVEASLFASLRFLFPTQSDPNRERTIL